MDANLKILSSATKTSSVTNATGVDFDGRDTQPLTYLLIVTAASGTSPTLDVKIQESDDNSTWRDFAAFKQMTTTGQEPVTGKSDARYRRYYATIAGTNPSFTMQIDVVPAGRYDKF